jgi:IstB-like ATP binding protein
LWQRSPLIVDGPSIVPANSDEWPPGPAALLDRLTHHVHILEMNGDSYRLKQSKQRQRHT